MDKFGYINVKGEMVVEPQFIRATEFVDDYAVAELPHNKASESALAVCCVDKQGNITPIRDLLVHSQITEGLFEVGKDGETKGFSDVRGNILVPRAYVRVSGFYQDRAVAMKLKTGAERGTSNAYDLILIDNRGRELRNIGLSFLRDHNWSDGLLRVADGEDTCYLDRDGEIVARAPELYSGEFSDGLASFMYMVDKQTYHRLQGYFDKEGRIAIPPSFDVAMNFSEGLAAVKKNDRWYYIDKEGKVAITLPDHCGSTREFRNGLAPVKLGAELVRDEPNNRNEHRGGQWGYIDRTGKVVIPPAFIEGSLGKLNFSAEGLACVGTKFDDVTERRFGFIDRTGKFVIEPQFLEATHFSSGLAAVQVLSPGFDPADWHDWELIQEYPSRAESLSKFFDDYPVYGMTRSEIHGLLGSGRARNYLHDTSRVSRVDKLTVTVQDVEVYGFIVDPDPRRGGFDFELLYDDDRVAGWRLASEGYAPPFNTSGRWPKVG